jgi:hypothetical protein
LTVISKCVTPVIVVTVGLIVAGEELPKLLVSATALFCFAVVGRLVWFYTRRW